jgi:hypothetical protein
MSAQPRTDVLHQTTLLTTTTETAITATPASGVHVIVEKLFVSFAVPTGGTITLTLRKGLAGSITHVFDLGVPAAPVGVSSGNVYTLPIRLVSNAGQAPTAQLSAAVGAGTPIVLNVEYYRTSE